MATGPISGDAHDDIDNFPTITLNSNPDATFRDLIAGSPAPNDKRGVMRNDTSLPKDLGTPKSKRDT